MASIYRRPNKPGGIWWFKDNNGDCHSLKTRVVSEAQAFLENQDYKKRTSNLGLLNRRATFEQFLIEYEADLKARRRKPKTASGALNILRAFQKDREPDKMIDINEDVARAWYKAQGERVNRNEIKPATVNSSVRALRSAWTRAMALNLADRNPFKSLSFFRLPKRKREIAADEKSIERLLAAAEKWNSEYWLMAMTFRWAGLRLNELTHLRPEDIDLKEGWIRVDAHPCDCRMCAKAGDIWTPKDYEQRRIPIHKALAAGFRRFPRAQGPLAFPSLNGGVRGQRAVELLFERLYRKAKVKRPAGELVHVFRHAFGSSMAKAGVPPFTLKDWLGHGKIETTLIYYHGDDKHSQTAMRKASKATF